MTPTRTSTPGSGLPCLGDAIVSNNQNTIAIINSGAFVDSYSSNLGSYGGSNHFSHGDVRSAWGITLNSGATVLGALKPNDPAGFTPVPTPTTYTNLGNLNINGNYTFQAGDYLVDSLNVNGSPIISVQGGPVRIWFNNLNSAGSIGAGSTVPEQLIFFSRTTAGQVNVNGSNISLSAVIFAPNVPVYLNGTGHVYGAIVGSQVVLNSAVQLHYDEDLGAGCGGNGIARAMPYKEAESRATWLPEEKTLIVVPNPSRENAVAIFRLAESGSARLTLFNLAGEPVHTLVAGDLKAGENAVDLKTNSLPLGVYLLVLEAQSDFGFRPIAQFKMAIVH